MNVAAENTKSELFATLPITHALEMALKEASTCLGLDILKGAWELLDA